MKKKMMRATTALTLVISMLLAGCGNGSSADDGKDSGDGVTITLTNQMVTEAPDIEEPLNDFIAEMDKKGIHIEQTTGNGDDLRTKVKAEFSAGNPPDIFFWNAGANLRELVEADLLLDVQTILDNTDKEWLTKDYWTESGWAPCTVDGESYYGLPIAMNTTNLIVNKDLFEQYNLSYPTTYEELKEVNKVFSENGIFTLGIGSKNGNPSKFFIDSILHQFVDVDYNMGWADGTTEFDCEGIRKGAAYIREMQDEGILTNDPVAYGDWSTNVELFNTGKAAMITAHPWTYSTIDTENINVEVIEWWTFPDTVVDPSTFYIGGTNTVLCITKSAYEDPKKQDAIQEIVEYLVSDDLTQHFVSCGTVPPRNPDTYTFELSDYLTGLSYDCVDFLGTDYGVYYTWGSMPNSAVSSSFDDFCDQLFAGSQTSDEVVAQLQAAMEENY